ncbi:MAG: hypothetical protein FWG68_04355 [Defluviitaleaceae bacterium]|nr:hypothetical protein [Defluviitaleaceae bacterium]
MDKFIEVNREVLEYIYAMQIADDEWFVCVVFQDGKTYELDIDVLPTRPVDWEVDWTFNPDTREILSELKTMRERGFLEKG